MELRAEGFSAGLCLDFDQACATFWRFVSNAREEKVKGKLRAEDKLGKNETWKPKYKSDHDILKRYYPEDFAVQLDPVLQNMSDTELDDLLETWDPFAEDPPE